MTEDKTLFSTRCKRPGVQASITRYTGSAGYKKYRVETLESFGVMSARTVSDYSTARSLVLKYLGDRAAEIVQSGEYEGLTGLGKDAKRLYMRG